MPPEVFRRCLEQVAADDNVDAMVPAACTAEPSKPLALSVVTQAEGVRLLHGASGTIPAYAYPGSAARALAHAARYGACRDRVPGQIPVVADLRPGDARALIDGFLGHSPAGGWLTPALTADLLACYGIAQVSTEPVASEDAALTAAAQLGGLVVLKADVPVPRY